MREKSTFLKDVAEAPPVLGHENAFFRIDQHFAIDHQPTMVGFRKTRDDPDHRRLAGPRAAEQRGDPAFG
ncbi:hypothetical protein D3C73_1429140 [compost metagenome]